MKAWTIINMLFIVFVLVVMNQAREFAIKTSQHSLSVGQSLIQTNLIVIKLNKRMLDYEQTIR